MRRASLMPVLAGMVVLLTWSPPIAQGLPLYGSSFAGVDGAVLYEVNPLTGVAGSPRATCIEFLVGIEFGRGDVLYGLSNLVSQVHPNSLLIIDPATGASELVGATGLSAITEGDLAFDPTTETLYGLYDLPHTGERKLFTLDVASGRASVLPGTLVGDPSAAAFGLDGTLYALDTGLQQLLTIDKNTGNVVASTPLSRALGSVAGMDVHPVTGAFYVADGGGGGTNQLYLLDVSTGRLDVIGELGVVGGLAGLAFLPEPSTVLLLTLGAAAIRRKPRS